MSYYWFNKEKLSKNVDINITMKMENKELPNITRKMQT